MAQATFTVLDRFRLVLILILNEIEKLLIELVTILLCAICLLLLQKVEHARHAGEDGIGKLVHEGDPCVLNHDDAFLQGIEKLFVAITLRVVQFRLVHHLVYDGFAEVAKGWRDEASEDK